MAQIKAILAEQSKSGSATSKPYQTRISFSTSWQGSDPYTQEVTVEDATENSRVDLHPMATTLVQLAEDGVSALYVENTNGTFTANSIGGPPSTSMVMLATVTEVTPAAQIPNTMTLSKSSINVSDTSPDTFTINGNYDGVVTVTSSDTSIVTASLSGNIVTVTAVGTGSATITVSSTGGNYTAASKTCSVTASFFVNPISGTVSAGSTVTFDNKTWIVQHVDGKYAYLASNGILSTGAYNSNGSAVYSGSTLAQKAATYQSSSMSADALAYCQDVTVNGVTSKVFIPSKAQYESDWDWPKASASNRVQTGGNNWYWTSTPDGSGSAWGVVSNGSAASSAASNAGGGFRPAVKVQFQA